MEVLHALLPITLAFFEHESSTLWIELYSKQAQVTSGSIARCLGSSVFDLLLGIRGAAGDES